jgi:hypothetical protein
MIAAFFALAFTGRLDTPSIVIFTIGVAGSVYRTIRRLPPPLTPRGAFLLSCGYIFFFLIDSVILSRSFIPASIHLVLFLQLAKLYQDKTDKDYLYLIILSFLQILAASSLTIDISFVATLFLFLVSLVSTLMSFEMYRSERKSTALAQEVGAPLAGMSVWATIWIIVTGVILFLVIPRVGTGYFTRATAQSLLVSGFTDTVQLGEIGQVKRSTAVVMHVRQISGKPFGLFKWRGIALDRFDGHNWLKTDRKHFTLQATPDGEYPVQPVREALDTIRYQILLEPLATTALFGAHQVRTISGRLGGIEYDSDDSVYLRFAPPRRTQYEVLSEIPKRSAGVDAPTQEDTFDADLNRRYLQLPRGLDPRITILARDITNKGISTLEKASLVESYLRRNYKYTLNLTWEPGPDPISTFLFDVKTGHCEYFASAMAILLRAAGIRTRLINGFQMGEYNPVGRDYIVRESDAHSWVEVYVPGRGWIEFDATPPDPGQRDVNLALQISQYIDAAELVWNSYVIVYDSGTQLQLFRSAQEGVQSAQTAFRRESDEWILKGQSFSDRLTTWTTNLVQTWQFWALFVLAGVSGAAYKYRRALRIQFRIWKIRRGRAKANEDVVEQMFYRATRLVEHRSQKRKPAETWREWIFALPDQNGRSILGRALEIFEKAKYGRVPVSDADFTFLEEAVRKLRRAN